MLCPSSLVEYFSKHMTTMDFKEDLLFFENNGSPFSITMVRLYAFGNVLQYYSILVRYRATCLLAFAMTVL